MIIALDLNGVLNKNLSPYPSVLPKVKYYLITRNLLVPKNLPNCEKVIKSNPLTVMLDVFTLKFTLYKRAKSKPDIIWESSLFNALAAYLVFGDQSVYVVGEFNEKVLEYVTKNFEKLKGNIIVLKENKLTIYVMKGESPE